MKILAAATDGRHGPLNFIRRVYRTTAVVSLIVALAVSGYFGWASAASYLLGALLGVGLMWVLERTVDFAIRRVQAPRNGDAGGEGRAPRKASGGAVIAGINVLKYVVIAVGLYLLIAHGSVRPWFLLAGYGTIYVVIALKVVGRMLVESSPDAIAATDGPGGTSRRP
ncbi:MAG: hypothetical protein PVH68_14940 [Armatimonadota bacterium]|jgi:hypothetical protein